MTTKTLPKRQSHANALNQKEQDVPGFPPFARDPQHQYTTADIAWILRGGVTNKAGRETYRQAMTSAAARNWLTAAYAKGEIDDTQVEMFWPEGERLAAASHAAVNYAKAQIPGCNTAEDFDKVTVGVDALLFAFLGSGGTRKASLKAWLEIQGLIDERLDEIVAEAKVMEGEG